MTDETRAPGAADVPAERGSAPKSADAGAAAAASDPTKTLEAEVSELKDKHLRALAEMENLRRRTEREVADARLYGIASFARDVLAVADNMRRAREAVAPELLTGADAGVKALLEGVELTERELNKVLEKHQVRIFEPAGVKFDPNVHQAMYEVPHPKVPAGHVAQVVQAGYMIGDRVLRPALVAVSKGEPKPAAEAPANDNADAAPTAPSDKI
jgi:molecular chaperone GrpE